MKTRIITAIVALMLFIPALIIGGHLLKAVIAFLSFVAIFEFFQMKKLSIFSIEGVLTLIATLSIIFARAPIIELPVGVDFFYIFFLCVMLLMSLTVYKSETLFIEDVSFLSLIALYVGGGFSGILYVREYGFGMVVFVFCIIWGTDTFAYFTGRAFGKHKLAPAISPNKTIEGSIGGVIGAIGLGTIALKLFNPLGFHFIEMTILMIALSVFGQLGDLVESVYKRRFNVKDSGKIFPGHGGVLDRFDSTFFAMFMFQIVLKFIGTH